MATKVKNTANDLKLDIKSAVETVTNFRDLDLMSIKSS
jgi:hypothetical protein